MKKMKKLAAALLALSCIFAVGGLTACGDDKKSSSPAVEVELDKLAVTMKVGDTEQIEATVVGAEGVTYSSSNTAVATVDQEGNVTAVGLGKAEITATSGGVTAVCKITVINIAVTDVAFRYEEVSVSIGSQKELNAMITPLIATNKGMTFASSAPEVATVDAKGVVTGVGEGETTVTVTTVDGGKTATCLVKVGKAVESIAFDVQEITLVATRTKKINATIAPSDAIIQDIVWTSSNAKVAAVAGGEVFGIGAGTAVITATTADGAKVATCNVTVEPYVNVVGVTLDKELANVANGGALQLQATVNPDNATDQEVVWTSSNTDVVRVDQNGLVTGYGEGTATVTVTSSKNKDATDSVEINVIDGASIFYNDYYTPTGDLTFSAYNVSEVKFNGTALAEGEYAYENNVVTIAKATLIGKSTTAANTLTFVSAENGDATVSVNKLYAIATNFNDGDLGAEIFAKNESVLSSSVQGGLAVLNMKAGVKAVAALNMEYLDAMFAYPHLEQLNVKLSGVENISGNVGIRLVKADGTWYNDVKTTTSNLSLFISRAAYNKMKADNDESVLSNNANIVFAATNVGANAKIKIDSVIPFYSNTTVSDQSNRIFADMPTDKTMQLELSSPATEMTLVHINAWEWKLDGDPVYSLNGNVISLTQDTPGVLVKPWADVARDINIYADHTGKRLWLSSAYSNEVFSITTAKTPAASQTISEGQTFNLNRPVSTTAYKLIEATVNGQALAQNGVSVVTDEKGAKGLTFAAPGTYRLQARVEKTVVSGDFVWTSYDIYDRIITVEEYVEVESVTLNKDQTTLLLNTSVQLKATVAPTDASVSDLAWTSSNPEIATVDAYGIVTAHKAGTVTITATSVDDETKKDSVELEVINETETTFFYNDYYTPTGSVSVNAKGVNEVKFNGTALAEGEYTYENEVVTVAKSVLLSKKVDGANVLTLVSAENGNIIVNTKMVYAKTTDFDEGELGAEIFAKNDSIISSFVENGLAVFNMAEGEKAVVSLKMEYLDAMFAYPHVEKLTVKLNSVENVSGGVAIRLVKTDGSWYNDVKTSTSDIGLFISRAAYNKMKADNDESVLSNNVAIAFAAANVGANAKIKIDYVHVDYNSTTLTEQSNIIYADMPTDKTMRLELGAYADTLSRLQISGQNMYTVETQVTSGTGAGTTVAAPFAMNGNVLSLVQDTSSVREGGSWPGTLTSISVYRDNTTAARLWVVTAQSSEVFGLITAKMPAATQTFAAGGSYAFTLPTAANLVAYKVVDAKVNGTDIADVAGVSILTDAKGATGVQFDTAGSYRLQVRVEKTVVSGSFVWTAFDVYDRIITVNA